MRQALTLLGIAALVLLSNLIPPGQMESSVNAHALCRRAAALMQAGEWARAESELAEAFRLSPSHYCVPETYGYWYESHGQINAAMSAYSVAAIHSPSAARNLSRLKERP